MKNSIFKRTITAAVCGLMILSLAACGGNGTNGNNTQPSVNANDKANSNNSSSLVKSNSDRFKSIISYKTIEGNEVSVNRDRHYYSTDGEHYCKGNVKIKMLGYEVVEFDEKIFIYFKLNVTNETNEDFSMSGYGQSGMLFCQNGVELELRNGTTPNDEYLAFPRYQPVLKSGATSDRIYIEGGLLEKAEGEISFEYDGNEIAKFILEW